ncbi:MAG: hypothetical protein K2K89_01980 [Ruminococcus sp.]|nr:hypothetical protein [Ruminococcus sp.]
MCQSKLKDVAKDTDAIYKLNRRVLVKCKILE